MVEVHLLIDWMCYKLTSCAIDSETLSINLPLLKEDIEGNFGIPKQNQRIKHDGKEIVDGYTYTNAILKDDSYLVVEHQESTASPYHLSKEYMRQRWPSMPEEELNRLHIEFNDLSKGVVDRLSLTEDEDYDILERSQELSSQVVMIQLFSSTVGTIFQDERYLTFQGQEFYLSELLEDGSGVMLATLTDWQYIRSTPEEYQRVKELNAKYEEDIRHCVQLLHDLPIALANSEKALAAVDISSEYFDVYELGAMVYEQKRIRREIEAQEQKLKILRSQSVDRPTLNWTQFSKFFCYRTLTLEFGMNRLSTGDIIQLIRVSDFHKPSAKVVEIKTELERVSVPNH